MENKNESRLIIALLAKGHIAAVTEEIKDLTSGIINVTGSTDSGEKGLFGVNLKEETEMIFCTVEEKNKDEVFEKIVETGDLENLPAGICISVPADRIYRSPSKKTVSGHTSHPTHKSEDKR